MSELSEASHGAGSAVGVVDDAVERGGPGAGERRQSWGVVAAKPTGGAGTDSSGGVPAVEVGGGGGEGLVGGVRFHEVLVVAV